MTEPTPEGWYPDPEMVDTQRYWDGSAWTDHVAPTLEAEPASLTDEARPAGWHRDPKVAGIQRYWDGSSWTEHVAPLYTAETPQQPASAPVAHQREPEAPAAQEPAAAAPKIGCLGIVGILLLVGYVLSLFGGDDEDPSGGGQDGRDGASAGMAQVMCENFVKDRLKAPSTADFSETKVSGADPGFTVSGAVDAENSFGAKIRDNYVCAVRYEGNDNWRLVSLRGIGD